MTGDWREQGQEKYLSGLEFTKRRYERYSESWDHDHCEFCGAKFCEDGSEGAATGDCLTDGYGTADNYRWICEPCFRDFRDKYHLRLRAPRLGAMT